jgi:Fe-S oxidoreductase
VKSYLEVLHERNYKPKRKGGEWVIHDPCLYARGLGIISQPRQLLSHAGYTILEPKRSGKMTYCCGGPIESISPRLSRRIAEMRFRELKETGRRIVTLCPICYANLSRVAENAEIMDIAVLLAGEVD